MSTQHEWPEVNINAQYDGLSYADLAGALDHSALDPTYGRAEIGFHCALARHFRVRGICVHSSDVGQAAAELRGSGVRIAATVGFPLGKTTTSVKMLECRDAIRSGASDIDMVINVGALGEGDNLRVVKDIASVVSVARYEGQLAGRDIVVKAILETGYLTNDQIVLGCQCVQVAEADMVKTSTGFAMKDGKPVPGATTPVLRLIQEAVGDTVGIKAAGGRRTYEAVREAIVDLKCAVVGVTATEKILTDFLALAAGRVPARHSIPSRETSR